MARTTTSTVRQSEARFSERKSGGNEPDMKAVWSYWSKPLQEGIAARWQSQENFLLSWVLSVESARKHYPRTCFCGDSTSAALLVDGLGLQFDEVQLALDDLVDADPHWWALGKLYAYLAQDEPFVHIENDSFLWKRLPAHVEAAPVFAQNPEYFLSGLSREYLLDTIEEALCADEACWLPPEWPWARRIYADHQRAIGCGIFGGRHIGFIHHYAATVIRFVQEPANQRALSGLSQRFLHMLSAEQFVLGACVDYHRHSPCSQFQGVAIEFLFTSLNEALRPLNDVGYTHLIGPAKHNPRIAKRIAERVAQDYPEQYKRCQSFVRDHSL